jgi:hypothetical protein
MAVEVNQPSSRWATSEEIAAAEAAWPRSVPDAVHIRQIAQEVGLSLATARLILAICRDGADGDCIEIAE